MCFAAAWENKGNSRSSQGRPALGSRLRCIAGSLILVAAAQLLAQVSRGSWLVLVRDEHPGPKVRAPDGFVSWPVVHASRQARVSTWQPANDAARVPGSLATLTGSSLSLRGKADGKLPVSGTRSRKTRNQIDMAFPAVCSGNLGYSEPRGGRAPGFKAGWAESKVGRMGRFLDASWDDALMMEDRMTSGGFSNIWPDRQTPLSPPLFPDPNPRTERGVRPETGSQSASQRRRPAWPTPPGEELSQSDGGWVDEWRQNRSRLKMNHLLVVLARFCWLVWFVPPGRHNCRAAL